MGDHPRSRMRWPISRSRLMGWATACRSQPERARRWLEGQGDDGYERWPAVHGDGRLV